MLIFNEMPRKVFNEREKKYSLKRKYKEQYYCTYDEVEVFVSIFEQLFTKKEQVDYDYFLNLFKKLEG